MREEYYLAIAGPPAPPVGEPVVEDVGSGEEARAPEVLRVFEHQEEVHVANQDPAQLHHSATCEKDQHKMDLFQVSFWVFIGLLYHRKTIELLI